MSALDEKRLTLIREALAERNLDGWLLFDFHGLNPIARRMLKSSGMATRRLFVMLPAKGPPTAVVHRIELQAFNDFPGQVLPYAAWQELEEQLGQVVRGKRLAIEYYPDDAVPYLDRVPAGVVELLRRLGAEVQSSSDLVSLFASGWSQQELADHRRAAEIIAEIARTTLERTLKRVGQVTEAEVQDEVLHEFEAHKLVTSDPPIVAFGPNSALPHYEPVAGQDLTLESDQVVLLDLWAGLSDQTVFADQTWMAFSGSNPSDRVKEVWGVVRDARDAVIQELGDRVGRDEEITGAELDRVARARIGRSGLDGFFTHRTGHSIDIELHGSGPHLDDFETHDTRVLLPGVGFSIEPGVYLPGQFGIRTEVNAVILEEGPEVTPKSVQREIMLPE